MEENCVWKLNREDRKCGYCTMRQRCKSRVLPKDIASDVGRDYVAIMREVTGIDPLGGTRKREFVWARNLIAYQMYRDGFRQEDIGAAIGRDRCTVVHCVRSVEDMLDNPGLFRKEMGVWLKFKGKLYLHKSYGEN